MSTMQIMTYDELLKLLESRKEGERLEIRERKLDKMDLSGMDFTGVDFVLCDLSQARLDYTTFAGSDMSNSLFDGTSLKRVNFENANLMCGCFRSCDLSEANIKGANLHCAVLELANLQGIQADDNTKWFKLHCPEKGAFLGYKRCMYGRLVQLLIPADALRTSATNSACRCNKAKVLTIKSFDYKENFDEAWSLVDENFVYRRGQWVEVHNFNKDRWFDSTTGIHFWLTREEAWNY